MRSTIAIASKELRVAFTTPVAYVVFTLFTVLTGFFFVRLEVQFQRQSRSFLENRQPSLLEHLKGFLGGLIRLSDVVYYLSIVVVGLFLTYRVVEAHRWR